MIFTYGLLIALSSIALCSASPLSDVFVSVGLRNPESDQVAIGPWRVTWTGSSFRSIGVSEPLDVWLSRGTQRLANRPGVAPYAPSVIQYYEYPVMCYNGSSIITSASECALSLRGRDTDLFFFSRMASYTAEQLDTSKPAFSTGPVPESARAFPAYSVRTDLYWERDTFKYTFTWASAAGAPDIVQSCAHSDNTRFAFPAEVLVPGDLVTGPAWYQASVPNCLAQATVGPTQLYSAKGFDFVPVCGATFAYTVGMDPAGYPARYWAPTHCQTLQGEVVRVAPNGGLWSNMAAYPNGEPLPAPESWDQSPVPLTGFSFLFRGTSGLALAYSPNLVELDPGRWVTSKGALAPPGQMMWTANGLVWPGQTSSAFDVLRLARMLAKPTPPPAPTCAPCNCTGANASVTAAPCNMTVNYTCPTVTTPSWPECNLTCPACTAAATGAPGLTPGQCHASRSSVLATSLFQLGNYYGVDKWSMGQSSVDPDIACRNHPSRFLVMASPNASAQHALYLYTTAPPTSTDGFADMSGALAGLNPNTLCGFAGRPADGCFVWGPKRPQGPNEEMAWVVPGLDAAAGLTYVCPSSTSMQLHLMCV